MTLRCSKAKIRLSVLVSLLLHLCQRHDCGVLWGNCLYKESELLIPASPVLIVTQCSHPEHWLLDLDRGKHTRQWEQGAS